MPNNIRAMLSVIAALVAVVAFYFEMQAGPGSHKWSVLGLAAFMVYAVWLFPEAKGQKDNGG